MAEDQLKSGNFKKAEATLADLAERYSTKRKLGKATAEDRRVMQRIGQMQMAIQEDREEAKQDREHKENVRAVRNRSYRANKERMKKKANEKFWREDIRDLNLANKERTVADDISNAALTLGGDLTNKAGTDDEAENQMISDYISNFGIF